uniref:apolipoprotein A-II n=1 Tax=Scatophagus argus TaxID=75038 RepID=UPI001ED84D3E|nr:apolipoprotein A-II [Scatophagus argus]
MNAKFALALILTLQVSLSLCEIPAPSQELVDKYDSMKATFYKRLLNLYKKLQDASAPYVESASTSEHGQNVRNFFEELQTRPGFQAFVKVSTGVGEEAAPLVEKARAALLGAYEHYLRPYVGTELSNGIDHVKTHLDTFMPAE